MPPSSAANPVQVVAKIDALLEQLSNQEELTVARLAELTGEPRSSVYRLVAALESAGLVEPGSRRGTVRLGLRLFRLGSRVAQRFDERQLALPVMERIHQETGETIFLCVPRGDEAVCIERLEGRRVQSLALRLGASLPLHAGAAPRTLLAWAPPAFQSEYAARQRLERYTEATPVGESELLDALRDIRARGYAISDGDVTPGIAAIGAPVFDHSGRVCAAVSISGLREAILGADAERVVELVVGGAAEISAALGGAPQRVTGAG